MEKTRSEKNLKLDAYCKTCSVLYNITFSNQSYSIQVFIVHTEVDEASTVIDKADDLGILSYGYAWMLTDELQNKFSLSQEKMNSLPDGILSGTSTNMFEVSENSNGGFGRTRKINQDQLKGQLVQ